MSFPWSRPPAPLVVSPDGTAAMQTDVFGPFVAFCNFDRSSQLWTGSVLVVASHAASPRPPTLDLHIAGNRDADRLVPGILLDSCGGYHAWRFNLSATLVSAHPQTLQYTVRLSTHLPLWTRAETHSISLPAAGEAWRWGMHSGSGQADAADEVPMWRDILAQHRVTPLALVVGAGGQVDGRQVWHLPLLRQWLASEPGARLAAPWTDELKAQVSAFYFRQYCTSWSHAGVAEAASRIPQVMVWGDADVFPGFGSQYAAVQQCPVMQGLFLEARRFACLFQQHATPNTIQQLNGTWGPAATANGLKTLGPGQALLLPDTCSERTSGQMLSGAALDAVCRRLEGLPAGVRHLVVVTPQALVGPGAAAPPAASEGPPADGAAAPGSDASGLAAAPRAATAPAVAEAAAAAPAAELMDSWGWSGGRAAQRLALVQALQGAAAARRLRVSLLGGSGGAGACWVGKLHGHPKEGLKEDPGFMTVGTRERLVARFDVGQSVAGVRSWVVVRELPFRLSAGQAASNGALALDVRMEHAFHREARPDTMTVEVPMLHEEAAAQAGAGAAAAAGGGGGICSAAAPQQQHPAAWWQQGLAAGRPRSPAGGLAMPYQPQQLRAGMAAAPAAKPHSASEGAGAQLSGLPPALAGLMVAPLQPPPAQRW